MQSKTLGAGENLCKNLEEFALPGIGMCTIQLTYTGVPYTRYTQYKEVRCALESVANVTQFLQKAKLVLCAHQYNTCIHPVIIQYII